MNSRVLKGEVALVTGAASGLGYRIASVLGHLGSHVVLCDISDELDEAVVALGEPGLSVEGLRCDVRDADQVRAAVDATVRRHQRLDLLINNAGIVRRTSVLDGWEQAVDDFDEIMGVNARGVFLFGLAVAPVMVRARSGHIINIATDHIHTCGWPDPTDHLTASTCIWRDERRPPGGSADLDVYDASKWALNGLTQGWAKSLREYGVRVNSICLGATDTPMLRGEAGDDVPASVASQWLSPSDVAGVLVDLILEGPGGRSGDNVGLWVGHPCTLPAPSPVLDVRG